MKFWLPIILSSVLTFILTRAHYLPQSNTPSTQIPVEASRYTPNITSDFNHLNFDDNTTKSCDKKSLLASSIIKETDSKHSSILNTPYSELDNYSRIQNLNFSDNDVYESILDIYTLEHSLNRSLAISQFIQRSNTLLKTDPNSINMLIELYTSIDNQSFRQDVLELVAKTKHPAVGNFALSLINSEDPDELSRGLEIVTSLNLNSRPVYEQITQQMENNFYDSERLADLVNALPKVNLSSHDHNQLMDKLNSLSGHDNEGIRETSLLKIGQYARSLEDLQPLLNELNGENSELAATAIFESKIADPALGELLFNKMTDNDETIEIRMIAAASLERFNLDEDQLLVREGFMEQNQVNEFFGYY